MKTVAYAFLALLSLSACGGPLGDLLTRPSAAKCTDAPGNTTQATALEVPLGQPFLATHCPGGATAALWWKTPAGPYAAGDRFHVTAEFRAGADNVDLRVGPLNATGDDVVVSSTEGSCSNPAGQDEDCTLTLAAAADVVYLRTGAGDPGKENFRLTITQE